MTIQGILFDKDGTLLDFDATWGPATASVLAALAGDRPGLVETLAVACGFDAEAVAFDAGSPIIAGDIDDFAPAWAEALGTAYDRAFVTHVDRLYQEASAASLTGYADVADGLALLAGRGLKLGLATNDSEAGARAHLAALGVLDRFDFVAGFDSGHGPKPEPGMVLAFAEAVGIAPEAVAMVGDSAHDMAAARAAGAHGIGIARTPAAARALEGVAEIVVTDLDGLARHLMSAQSLSIE
ncbi:HAD-IA family hydrolase [Aurantimonas sp. MSK8Z-1]|uniref:HAD family hydrolase n=1 Tax=Mangrovibrevibacter kandeliae TaxID=2968473 RepID=UPI0021188FAA|nr:HAD-IA family hydrolase [Aurantimonas sp. MSK8Z-1]MCW4115349.1 HAD-IA family hydrolase [Aurantimonas sp. MSK8Z-1]